MIRATPKGLNVSLTGAVVYLDNYAIIDLAKKHPALRKRFMAAIHAGIDLLFSVTNAAQISGPRGRSADLVRAFLDEIGPRWFPARLDVTQVAKDEIAGIRPEEACIDSSFFKSYMAYQMRLNTPSGGNFDKASERAFLLGALLDRVSPQWDSISEASDKFDEMIKTKMKAQRENFKRDPALLDQKFPEVPFDPTRPACFAYFNLMRSMAIEAHQLRKGDGMDFCHAVIASAYSSFAALDTDWKRRLAGLPQNQLARIYGPLELEQMVSDMERWCDPSKALD